MNATELGGGHVDPGAFATFTSALIDVAAEVEATEHRLKQEILAAARAGDCDHVIEIVEKWLVEPPVEVLSKALPSSRGAR
jgi:hypothetical protein